MGPNFALHDILAGGLGCWALAVEVLVPSRNSEGSTRAEQRTISHLIARRLYIWECGYGAHAAELITSVGARLNERLWALYSPAAAGVITYSCVGLCVCVRDVSVRSAQRPEGVVHNISGPLSCRGDVRMTPLGLEALGRDISWQRAALLGFASRPPMQEV